MSGYKHIETCIGTYIAARYDSAIEVGIGETADAARIILSAGKRIRCTDIRHDLPVEGLSFSIDNVFDPDIRLYEGADVIYAIRPAIEMVPPLIALVRRVDADLLVYHLGFELWGDGGEVIDCGVPLHRYHRRQKPSKRVD